MNEDRIIYEGTSQERLDVFLKEAYPELSRSYIQKLIKDGNVKVNGKQEKSNFKLKTGDIIDFNIEMPKDLEEVEATEMDIDILYEDDDFIFVNKPKGMVVHPAPGHFNDTLVNGLLYYAKEKLSGINGVLRPGIVHRIDKDTTGVIVVCKNDDAHKYMASLLETHDIERSYRVIVYGVVKDDSGTIDAPIGRHPVDRKKQAVNVKNAKNAVTNYKVLERFSKYSYLECKLKTGRTHQIRVHMAFIHHPVLGDEVYCKNPKNKNFEGQTLHAYTLGFKHFRTGENIIVTAPLPEYFENTLEHLRKYDSI